MIDSNGKIESIYKFIVDPDDCDRNKHLNNIKYFEKMEGNRIKLQRNNHIADEDLRPLGLAFYIISNSLNYSQELNAGDEVEIHTQILSRSTAAIYMHQQMKRDGAVVNNGYFVLTFVDIENGNRPISLDRAAKKSPHLEKIIAGLPNVRHQGNQDLPEIQVAKDLVNLRRSTAKIKPR